MNILYDCNYTNEAGDHLGRIKLTKKGDGFNIWLSEFSLEVWVKISSIHSTKGDAKWPFKARVLSKESWKPFSTNPKDEQLIPVIPNEIIYNTVMYIICEFIKECPDEFYKLQPQQLQMSI